MELNEFKKTNKRKFNACGAGLATGVVCQNNYNYS